MGTGWEVRGEATPAGLRGRLLAEGNGCGAPGPRVFQPGSLWGNRSVPAAPLPRLPPGRPRLGPQPPGAPPRLAAPRLPWWQPRPCPPESRPPQSWSSPTTLPSTPTQGRRGSLASVASGRAATPPAQPLPPRANQTRQASRSLEFPIVEARAMPPFQDCGG